MSASLVLAILCVVICVLTIARKKKNESNNSVADDSQEDFDKAYFEAVEKGEAHQQFLVIGGQQDCALIRSLLAADDITTYAENENVNRMYGGNAASVTGMFAIKLYILVKDYEKAYEIVCDYARSKLETKDDEKVSEIKTVTEAAVTGLFFSPVPVNSEQKYMGITILPKVEKE